MTHAQNVRLTNLATSRTDTYTSACAATFTRTKVTNECTRWVAKGSTHDTVHSSYIIHHASFVMHAFIHLQHSSDITHHASFIMHPLIYHRHGSLSIPPCRMHKMKRLNSTIMRENSARHRYEAPLSCTPLRFWRHSLGQKPVHEAPRGTTFASPVEAKPRCLATRPIWVN